MAQPNYERRWPEVIFSPDFEKNIKAPFRLELPKKICEKLLSDPARKARFLSYFGDRFDGDPSDAEIIKFVEADSLTALQLHREKAIARGKGNENSLPDLLENPLHQDHLLLLWIAGELTPILDGDWDIDRGEESARLLSFNSLGGMETAIVLDDQEEAARRGEVAEIGSKRDSLNTYIHLHLGPGNGIPMQELRERGGDSDLWREIGVGYKLHHKPTDALKHFIRPGLSSVDRAFVEEVMTEGVRAALQKKWFTRKSRGGWKPRTPEVFDMNDIYKLLSNPKKYGWFDPNQRVVRGSGEYENDQTILVSEAAYRVSLEYLGTEESEMERALAEFRLDQKAIEIRQEKARYAKEIKSLSAQNEPTKEATDIYEVSLAVLRAEKRDLQTALKPKLSTAQRAMQDVQKEVTDEIRSLTKRIKRDPDNASLKNKRILLIARATDLKRQLKTLEPAATSQVFDSGWEPDISVLDRFFTDDFVDSLKDFSQNESARPPIDLNRWVVANSHNFVPGFFTEIAEKLPGMMVDAITGIRSNSHEDDKSFQKSMRHLVTMLKPGRVLSTDGFRSSYSRLLRLEHTGKAIKSSGIEGLNACLAVGKKSDRLESLLIETRDLSGDFRLQNDRSYISSQRYSKHYSQPLSDFIGNDIGPIAMTARLLDVARRTMLSLSEAGEDKEIFDGYHDQIKAIVTGLLKGQPPGRVFNEEDQKDLEASLINKMQSIMREIKSKIGAMVEFSDGVEIYRARTIHTFRSRNIPSRNKINKAYEMDLDSVSDQSHFQKPEVTEALSRKKKYLQDLLFGLKHKYPGKNIIHFLRFTDCVTNDILYQKLRELTGGGFFQNIDIDFSNLGRDMKAEAGLNKFERDGGLFIGGGSWANVDQAAGNFIRPLMEPVVNKILNPNSNHVGLGECFSFQLFSEIIGERIATKYKTQPQIRVEPGMLEFGPVPLKPLKKSRLFMDFPGTGSMVAAQTHGRHLLYQLPPSIREKTSDLFCPIASSRLTGQPVGFMSYQQRFGSESKKEKPVNLIGLQPHAEIGLNNMEGGIHQVQKQLEPSAAAIEKDFGISLKTLNNGFNSYADRSQKLGHREEGGDHLLVNALILLLEGLYAKHNLKTPKL